MDMKPSYKNQAAAAAHLLALKLPVKGSVVAAVECWTAAKKKKRV